MASLAVYVCVQEMATWNNLDLTMRCASPYISLSSQNILRNPTDLSSEYFSSSATAPVGQGLLIVEALRSHTHTHTHTHTRTTLDRTPLDEWSALHRGDLTTHNQRQTSTPPERFEPAFPTSEQPQTHALDRMTTGIGSYEYYSILNFSKPFKAQRLLYVPPV